MTLPVAISSGARVVQALGLNSIPVVGLFLGGWSTGTTLALYWIESVVATIFTAIRILLHRRLTRKAGHWNGDTGQISARASPGTTVRGKSTLLASFLWVMLPFTAAHGLYLAVILFGVLPQVGGPGTRLALGDLRLGAQAIAIWLGAGLVFDLVGIRSAVPMDRGAHAGGPVPRAGRAPHDHPGDGRGPADGRTGGPVPRLRDLQDAR